MGPNHLHLPIDNLARELGIADSVIQTDGKFADHQALISIYNAADVYVNPSLYEGFSMTLVEALACGLPVVVSNRAALAEMPDGRGARKASGPCCPISLIAPAWPPVHENVEIKHYL